jgi:hypothetical protein
MIQGLIVLWNPTYTIPRWHGSLLTIGIGLLSAFFNTWGAKALPIIEGFAVALHVLGFFGIIIPLWVVAPKTSAKKVFTSFEDHGGWGSVGTACIIGQIGPIFSFIGADAGTHMCKCGVSPIRSGRYSFVGRFDTVLIYTTWILETDQSQQRRKLETHPKSSLTP